MRSLFGAKNNKVIYFCGSFSFYFLSPYLLFATPNVLDNQNEQNSNTIKSFNPYLFFLIAPFEQPTTALQILYPGVDQPQSEGRELSLSGVSPLSG